MSFWWQQLWLVTHSGAGGRYWLGGVLLRHVGSGFPWGTFAANMFGAFASGFLAVWLEGRSQAALDWRAFLIVGPLGGLTTNSALKVKWLVYARSSRTELALLYLVLTRAFGLLLVWGGARIATAWRP